MVLIPKDSSGMNVGSLLDRARELLTVTTLMG